MSYFDKLVKFFEGFIIFVSIFNFEFVGIVYEIKFVFGVQFYFEVEYIFCGVEFFKNFVVDICGVR